MVVGYHHFRKPPYIRQKGDLEDDFPFPKVGYLQVEGGSPFKGPHDTPLASSQERMMLEMEAELPLSNAQLYAEMKKEMRGAGGPTLHVCCYFSPLFSTLGWMVWVAKESHDCFCLNTSSHFGVKDSEPPTPPSSVLRLKALLKC